MSAPVFGGRAVAWLVGITAVSLVTGLVLMLFAPELAVRDARGANGFSRSGLGHKAFLGLLGEMGVPVVTSRHATASRLGREATLLLVEPRPSLVDRGGDRILGTLLDARVPTLLILPKWEGRWDPSAKDRQWSVHVIPPQEVRAVLQEAVEGEGIRLRRLETGSVRTWWTEDGQATPTFPTPALQLVEGSAIEPVVHCAQGILLGRVRGVRPALWILSDPDLIGNAGLHRGSNATFAWDLIERIRPGGGAVIVDEVLHGLESAPSVWRELFSFPLGLVMAHLGLCLAVLLWASAGRFGAPRPLPPRLEPGHRFLVANTARLLRQGVAPSQATQQYFEHTLEHVRRALQVPGHLPAEGLDAWLDRIACARGVKTTVADLREEVHATRVQGRRPARALAAAHEIHRWKEEILHGPRVRSHDS